MYRISFRSSFIRQYNNLEEALQDEILEKVGLLKDRSNHKKLKVHKLQGHLAKYWSFSVNYKIRIVFYFESREEIVLSLLGDHDIYK